MSSQQDNNIDPIEKVKLAKKAFTSYGLFCMVGLIAITLSVFLLNLPNANNGSIVLLLVAGLLVIAAPCMMAFILKFGIFCEVGPVFGYSDTYVGNIIYRRMTRDYNSQAAMNIGFTIIKAFIIFLVSLVLTPIITLVLYIAYKKSYKKAIAYSYEHDLDTEVIPKVNKLVVQIAVGVIIVLFIGAIIASIISGNIREEEKESDNEEYSTLLETASNNIPDEYYANAYKGDNNSGGYIAEFTVDGKKVLCGALSNNFSGYVEGLDTGSIYYIIDDSVYIDYYQTGSFEQVDNATIKDYLLGRHLSECFGDGAEYDKGQPYEDTTRIEYTYNDEKQCIYVDSENNIVKMQIVYDYTDTDVYNKMPETAFVIDKTVDLTQYKDQAEQLLNQ